MHSGPSRSWWVLGAGTAVSFTALGLVAGQWLGASNVVEVVPARIDLGDCRVGDVKIVPLRVVNHSAAPVTLTGIYTPCSCVMGSSLPVQVEARGESTLRLTVHASGEPGEFTREAVLYTDSKICPQMPIKVAGRMIYEAVISELEPIPQPAVEPKPGDD